MGQATCFGLIGMAPDPRKGFDLIRKAADLGDGDAYVRLSQISIQIFDDPLEAYYWALIAEYKGVPGSVRLVTQGAKLLASDDVRDIRKRFNKWVNDRERGRFS